jgi:hypothetical protein
MPGYDESVFLNCPFDGEYQPFLEAVVFTVYDCGFVARCAMEIDDGSQVRISKITQMIQECRFGIHDLSRTELDAGSELPRFNMPLELGLFLGAKTFGRGKQREKLCLVMDREPYRYQKFCSDIAGQDIRSHAGTPEGVISLIRNWLQNASRGSEGVIPSGSRMEERYTQFQQALPLLCEQLRLDREDLIFNDYATLVAEWLKENSW